MAGRGSSRVRSQTYSRRFMKVLTSAFFEWLLIVMLFIQAILAYLITTFARYCELPIPCLLCSRLDHLLGNGKAGVYWDLICRKHKSEISSLVFCNLHNKLVDVHEICESCLFSFATKDKSNSETFRLLVGKLGTHPKTDVDDDQKPLTTAEKPCCCCKKPWTSRGNVPFLLQPKTTKIESAEVDALLTREIKPRVDASNRTKRPYQFVPSSFQQRNVDDPLMKFEYSELKISSDTESDVLISDAEDLTTLEHQSNSSLKDKTVDAAQVDTRNTKVVDKSVSGVQIDHNRIVHATQVDTLETKVVGESVSRIHGDQIVDVAQVGTQSTKNVDLSVSGLHINVDEPSLIDEVQYDLVDRHEVPSVTPNAIGHGLEELSWQQIDLNDEPSSSPELINSNDVPEPLEDADKPLHYKGITEEQEQIPADEIKKEVDKPQMLHVTSDSAGSTINADVTEGKIPSPKSLDLGSAYKLAISSKGRQLSGKLLEQLAVKDSRASEDLKLLLTQLSAARGLDSPVSAKVSPRLSGNLEGLRLTDFSAKVSPRLSGNLEGLKISDSSASAGLQILQSRISLDRNDSRNSLDRGESGFESVTFSTVSEIEGEGEVEQLKRQIEHDKKVLSSLLKELEEEKNASAESANQAMAMINKLQEEKATLQMEALHDIRMMEEQAEYDMNALEAANDLLAEKDREIQDLEAELDYYRIKYPDELTCDDKNHISKSSSLDFEDEKTYISKCLIDLEKKLDMYSNKGAHSVQTESEGSQPKDGIKERSEVQKDNGVPVSNGAHSLENQKYCQEGETELVALVDKVTCLNERLQALEMDKKFLEHTINTLRNGEEGFSFVQEIASHLRELRSMTIKGTKASS